MSKLSLAAVAVAESELGTKEVPLNSNWGSVTDPSDVDDFLRSVGINFPAAWCAAFVYWCFQEAAKKLGVLNPLPKTGGVLFMYSEAKPKRVPMPQVGDLFVMDFGGGRGHIGIIVKIVGLTLHTIEGNSNNDGSRDGHTVVRHTRQIAQCKGFLRF